MIKLIEKIEGEASLDFHFKDEVIEFVDINFFSTRGIEDILKQRSVFDALVINPRVCGICGHAHLIATVKAIEDCYDGLFISEKAKIIRELTLNFEIIQNHFKWFYLTIMPLMGFKQYLLKATVPSSIAAKAIATIAGQYPHTSYAIAGGVTSDPVYSDLVKIENYLNEIMNFFKKNVVDIDFEKFTNCEDVNSIFRHRGDLLDVLLKILENGWEKVGKSYDRFLVLGENSYFMSGKSLKTILRENIYLNKIAESENQNSYAKNVTYNKRYYEVGPLSRAMIKKTPLVKATHRRYADSVFSRILARVCEIPQLLNHSLKLIKRIDLGEPSYIKPPLEIGSLSAEGTGVVEAARGSLVHKVFVKEGVIKDYRIITPTQWNLSNGTRDKPAPAQKAMMGLRSTSLAELVFKSFDVCSVCTTH